MWDFFIRNNRFAYLFLVVLILVGAYSMVRIPKESSPEVVVPIGVVTTILPGAPAADVETLVTNEIERGLTTLENVKDITSTSREGVSSIVVEFTASADIDASIQDLKDEVDALQSELPDTAEDSTVTEVDLVDQPILSVSVAADTSDVVMSELADALERDLEAVPGVSRVVINGVRDSAITVIVEQTALQQFNLSLSEVVSALQAANLALPVGQIVSNGLSYNVAVEGDLSTAQDIRNTGVAVRGGQPIFVKDIAVVEDGLSDAATLSRLSVAGQPSQQAMSVEVYKQSGGNIITITSAVNTRLGELQAEGELLSEHTVAVILDSGDQIRGDLVQLSTSGFQTVALVVLLLVVAIGWREGLLAGAAIPLSFLFGFIGLWLSGNTINFLSLFALILGIGILVDSAIVMIEGINRKMKSDPTIDKRQAAIATIREFATPLIAGTLTTVSMFVGLFIVSGIIGQYISSIPFTLVFLLFASMFVALAILPLLAASFLKRQSVTAFEQKQLQLTRQLEQWYRRHITPFLDNETLQFRFLALIFAALVFAVFLAVNVWVGLVAAPLIYLASIWYRNRHPVRWWTKALKAVLRPLTFAGIIAAAVFVVGQTGLSYAPVSVIFFEETDADYVVVELEKPEGTTKELTDIDMRRVEEYLLAEDTIQSYTVTVGSGSAFGSGATGEKFANVFITLKEDRDIKSTEYMEVLRSRLAELSDLKLTVSQLSGGPPTGAAIIVKFLGDDLDEITQLATESVGVFSQTPGIVNVETSTNNNNTEFVLNLDRAKLAAAGVSPLAVSQAARTAVYGTEATALTTLTDDIAVTVKLNITGNPAVVSETVNQLTINDLQQITVPTATGPVPLSSLADVSLRESSAVIRHEDNQRVVTITADVAEGANARQLQTQVVENIRQQLVVPDDVTISTGGGEAEESNQAFAEMGLALVVGMLLMVCVLVLQFNSYRHTWYVLSILPYSLIGIFVGLAIMRSSLSFPSMMGFIALSGIVVNNSILLIDMMNELRRTQPALPLREVVLTAASTRLRPILLTTTTTVIGMIPLIFSGDLWAPLAYAVMFGLVFSVLITLVLIPITYYRKPGELSTPLDDRVTQADTLAATAAVE